MLFALFVLGGRGGSWLLLLVHEEAASRDWGDSTCIISMRDPAVEFQEFQDAGEAGWSVCLSVVDKDS